MQYFLSLFKLLLSPAVFTSSVVAFLLLFFLEQGIQYLHFNLHLLVALLCGNIRIYHECEVQIDKSVPRDPCLALQGSPLMPNSFVCLFGLMLYVHGKQLRSCRDGQLSYPHCSWASFPEAGYQY